MGEGDLYEGELIRGINTSLKERVGLFAGERP